MSCSSPSLHARFSFECRPKLLKDFLKDDSPSYSRKYYKSTRQRVSNKASSHQLLRSRSSRAASATISAIHKVINIVKFLPFASVKSPSILPRSISRKLSSRNHKENEKHMNYREVSVKVKVKDILRWKSSRDLIEEKSTPTLDYAYSPYRYACTATATTTTSIATSSKRSSWCDSDFTAEELPYYHGKRKLLEEGVGGCCIGETRGIKLDPKEHLWFDENEQHSPVSVLESPFREDQEEYLSFHRTPDTDRTKCMLMQRSQELESFAEENTSFEEDQEEEKEMQKIDEKARQLLNHLKETKSLCKEDSDEEKVDQLLLNFFWHELIMTRYCKELQSINVDESDEILMREAKSWINGEYNGEYEWEIEEKREAYIKDMQRVGSWNKFEEEKEELILDLEFDVFNDLAHEVLADLFPLS